MTRQFNVRIYAYPSTVGEHTFVKIWRPDVSRVRKYGCFGGTSGPGQTEASALCRAPGPARERASILVATPEWNDAHATIPKYADLRYALNGVCHQAANRVSTVLCIGGPVPEVTTDNCPSYLWTKLLYGRFGLATGPSDPWPQTLASLLAQVMLLPPREHAVATGVPATSIVDLVTDLVWRVQNDNSTSVLRDALPPSVVAEYTTVNQRARMATEIVDMRARMMASVAASAMGIGVRGETPRECATNTLKRIRRRMLRRYDTPLLAQMAARAGANPALPYDAQASVAQVDERE